MPQPILQSIRKVLLSPTILVCPKSLKGLLCTKRSQWIVRKRSQSLFQPIGSLKYNPRRRIHLNIRLLPSRKWKKPSLKAFLKNRERWTVSCRRVWILSRLQKTWRRGAGVGGWSVRSRVRRRGGLRQLRLRYRTLWTFVV